jgi:hypothetical protein
MLSLWADLIREGIFCQGLLRNPYPGPKQDKSNYF